MRDYDIDSFMKYECNKTEMRKEEKKKKLKTCC